MPTSLFDTMAFDGLLQDRVGKMVDVYDARNWPVVRVASVYIHPVDNVHKVTQAVLSDPSVGKKKWRANKYTVAVGTTHGHVQVFLSDEDLVLKVFQQCVAEEKCLLLIKKPKEASKKLLKTQSLNNLSMSDTQLYRQKHDVFSAFFTANKTKGQLSTIAESQKEKKKGSKKPTQVNAFVPIPELGIYTPEQHVLKNGTYAQYCHTVREVNNNNLANAKNYENLSNLGVARASDSSLNTSLDDSVSSYGFGQREATLFVNPGLRPNKLDETYHSCVELTHPKDQQHPQASRQKQPPKPPRESSLSYIKQVKEEPSNLDPAYRSHSLGDLTTGLTFSLVGQNKLQQIWSDADENCWDVNNKNISKCNMASSKELLGSALSSPQKPSGVKEKNLIMNTQVRDQYISEPAKNQFLDNRRQFTQEKFPFQRQNSAPEVVKPQLSVFQTHVRIETEENNVRSRGVKTRPVRDNNIGEESFDSNLESKAPVIRQPLLNNLPSTRQAQGQYSKGEKNATRELSPMKPKRSLPVVPAADTSERVKRLTEVMRSRIASSSSRSSSQGRQTSESMSTQTNASGRSVSETNSDNDVFTDTPGQYFMTSDRLIYTNGSATHSSPKCQPKSAGNGLKNGHVDHQMFRAQERIINDNYCPPISLLRRQMIEQESNCDRNFDFSYSEHQPVPQADRSSDSAQTTVTNQSHNGSIMDSGYTTNNESDSFILTQRGLYSQPHRHCQPSPGSPHDQRNIVSQHSPVTLMHNSGTQPKCYQIYNTDNRKQSNLTHSRQFGSVQNISSSQAHGSPRVPAEVSNNFINQERSAPQGHKPKHSEGVYHPAVRKVESRRLTLDGSFYPSHNSNKLASVTYANTSDSHKTYMNVNNGHSSNGTVKKTYEDYHNIEPKYLVINSNRHYANTDGLFDRSNRKCRNSDQESNYVNQTSLIPQDNRNKPTYNHNANNVKPQSVKDSKGIKYNQDEISPNSEPWNSYLYRRPQAKKDDGPPVPGVELRPKPVPIAGRPARGRTLPGGFRLNEVDDSSLESTGLPRDLSLSHLLQTHELLPVTVRLPEQVTMLSMLQLKEASVCPLGSSTPESPKGRTAHIGSPGSAFTPVRHSSERSDHQSGSKLICVGQVAGEFHRLVVLGSLQQGDLIVEVNSSLCLDGNVQYMETVLRNCSGKVTFTIARLRETHGNSTPIDFISQSQRIKSLEAEISRLDDLIQLRDEKIKDLTSWKGPPGGNCTRGTISDLNGAVEGMVIGDDEYVV